MAPPQLRLRTVTCFTTLGRDNRSSWPGVLSRACAFLHDASSLASEKYNLEVQTLRIATNNFIEYMDTSSDSSLVEDAKYIEKLCADCGVTFVSIGGCEAASSFDQVVQILGNTSNIFCNIQMGGEETGDDNESGLQRWCEAAAECVSKLSRGSKSESFRFTGKVNGKVICLFSLGL